MKLTEKRLLAIREALSSRLAGALDDTDIDRQTYQDALEWARDRITDKRRHKVYRDEAKKISLQDALRVSPSSLR